ncbi:VOC family protein [Gordonia sp. CPCC 206044]
MPTMLFVNLAVADVSRSRAFYTGLGVRFDALFCDEGTLCFAVNDNCRVLLHREERFAGYVAGEIADLRSGREAVVAVSAASRAAVDRCADAALEQGGTLLRSPEDLGFMYSRSFCDLDGHAWEIVWMDPSQIPSDD